jgi:hypothetical protein
MPASSSFSIRTLVGIISRCPLRHFSVDSLLRDSQCPHTSQYTCCPVLRRSVAGYPLVMGAPALNSSSFVGVPASAFTDLASAPG